MYYTLNPLWETAFSGAGFQESLTYLFLDARLTLTIQLPECVWALYQLCDSETYYSCKAFTWKDLKKELHGFSTNYCTQFFSVDYLRIT